MVSELLCDSIRFLWGKGKIGPVLELESARPDIELGFLSDFFHVRVRVSLGF